MVNVPFCILIFCLTVDVVESLKLIKSGQTLHIVYGAKEGSQFRNVLGYW